MTCRFISTGLLTALVAFAPGIAFAYHTIDHFDDFSYDNLYRDVDIYDEPYYGSNYYNSSESYNDYRYGYRYPTYNYSYRTYSPQYTMPGFRCYYWGRDGKCMNYSYRQSPTYLYNDGYGYYGNYYGNVDGNYGYPYYNY